MNGKLILREKDEMDLYEYEFSFECNGFDYSISINTDLSDSFIDLISNSKDLCLSIDENLEHFTRESDVEFLNKVKNNNLELLKNIEYVSFDFSIDKIHKYIEKNPILKTKKILINDNDFDTKKVNDIKRVFGNDTSNLYFYLVNDIYNEELVSFEDYSNVVNTIDSIVFQVNRLDFSPIEKIMYVYDLVRDRVYTVSSSDDKSESRRLTKILKNNEIVCAGYAILFKTILNKLGINCELVNLVSKSDSTLGHARNEVYIQDKKYGINGVYYFDPTFDSKRSEDDKLYLLKYRHFARTKTDIETLDNGKYDNINFPYFSDTLLQDVKNFVDKVGLENVPKILTKSVNHMSYVIKDETIMDPFRLSKFCPDSFKLTKEEVYKKLKPLIKKFDSPLTAETLLQVLYNVRKKQYYINPEKYQFSFNDFYKIILISDWKFDKVKAPKDLKEYARFISSMFTLYGLENDLYKNIERVKLAKTLRLVYENKKQK